jgi:hypothetical protein
LHAFKTPVLLTLPRHWWLLRVLEIFAMGYRVRRSGIRERCHNDFDNGSAHNRHRFTSQTTTVTNDAYQVTGTITAAGARAITEVGVFDAAGTGSPPTGGNMDIYGDFSVVNLASATPLPSL